jgi:hypothetical protein
MEILCSKAESWILSSLIIILYIITVIVNIITGIEAAKQLTASLGSQFGQPVISYRFWFI